MRGSYSIAMTRLAAASSFTVRLPVPGPISSTMSVLFTPAFSTMLSTTSGFLRMCWPFDLWNSMVCTPFLEASPPTAPAELGRKMKTFADGRTLLCAAQVYSLLSAARAQPCLCLCGTFGSVVQIKYSPFCIAFLAIPPAALSTFPARDDMRGCHQASERVCGGARGSAGGRK